MPPEFLANAALHTVWHCVDAWHAGTCNAYLVTLYKFVVWFPCCGALWPPAGVLTEAKLCLYVDFLLSWHVSLCSTQAASNLLSVASVCNKLSTLMACFQVIRLSRLDWPLQACYKLMVELTAHCKAH